MKSKWVCLALFSNLFLASSDAYEDVYGECYTSPGCTGRIVYSKSESGFLDSMPSSPISIPKTSGKDTFQEDFSEEEILPNLEEAKQAFLEACEAMHRERNAEK